MDVPRSSLLCFLLTQLLIGNAFSKKPGSLQVTVQSKPDECSELARYGDEVFIHYTGYLVSGEVFDSSLRNRGKPLPFVLGKNQVIPGLEEGVQGMCVGEKRKLIIPPHMAFGWEGIEDLVPPEATVTFETELMGIRKKTPERTSIFELLQFLALPAFTVYVVYHLYARYKKETTQSTTNYKVDRSKGKKRK